MQFLEFVTEGPNYFPPAGTGFNTVRLGRKWVNALRLGDVVGLLHAPNAHTKTVIGFAKVHALGVCDYHDVLRNAQQNITNVIAACNQRGAEESLEQSLRAGYKDQFSSTAEWAIIDLQMM